MTTEDTEARYRLPRTVTPSRYELVLQPDLAAGSFAGNEDVSVTVTEPVTEILLNAVDLEITRGSLEAADGHRIEIAETRVDPETERVHLELRTEAEPGEWTLHLDFRGELNDKLVGFYRSTYQGPDGGTEVIATTHFEATDARRAFPSWDEPDLKAVFGVTLIVGPDLTALSNGPETERTTLDDGRVRIVFADTMSMSTYLVAFVIGHLELTDPVDAGGVPTRVAHVPGKGPIASFALEVGAHSLNWFAEYYGIPYPDKKVDHIALPDFAQGAMENLGCITYREAALLVDPASSTHGEQLDVAETVAHELAHMWFGDLVTMRWWNGLWLNEAFATFMAMLAVDAYRPDWEVWNQFARSRSAALEVDALVSTRSIEYPVHSPDDANGMFDTLTYLKGGAILRMLEQYLGADRFREGIRRYLRKHAYGNAETHDLWDALEEETGEPVRRIMDTWIWQGGYPLISVTIADDGTLRFSQRRYSPSRPDDDTQWAVPLLVRQAAPDGRGRTEAILVEADGATLPMLSPDAVVVANAGGISFVRVWYDEVLAGRLAGSAVLALSPLERYALVDDAWAAVVDGSSTASSFCRFVEGFTDETELPVWQLILTGLSWCDRFLEDEPRDRFRDYVRDLLRPAIDRLGWEASSNEPDLVRALRGALAQALAVLGDDPEAKAQMRELESEARGGRDVDAHLASAAVQVVATNGDAGDFARYWQMVHDGVTPQEQLRYLYALARFRDPDLFDRLLVSTLTDDVRPQDAPFLLATATTNRDLGDRAWRFIADNWDAELARFASSNIISLASGARFLSMPEQQAAVEAFFETHSIPQAGLMLDQTLERQRIYVALRERAEKDLAQAFSGSS
ncbi:MAG: M1 family metallopeptidase [Actinomycetota bacterium]